MLLIFFVLPFFVVNAELDKMAKVAFKQSNREYNSKIKWSNELEKKALEYLNSGGNVEEDMMVIKEERTYRKNSSLNIGIKLLDAFYGLMWYETEKIRNLPKGSQYGCNIVYKEESDKDILRYACLYRKN
uniref:SCP domain-containing protein n=1 Tax=Haemonchus contortus TaxID=6289 RepID=A0A7I4Z0P6_HAECO